jgi:hypothetical protein
MLERSKKRKTLFKWQNYILMVVLLFCAKAFAQNTNSISFILLIDDTLTPNSVETFQGLCRL